LRVRPTHDIVKSTRLKSWIVESSLDSVTWTTIDRRMNNTDLKVSSSGASFAVSNSAECRFIRLTQTDKNHRLDDYLMISAFEIFGTLLQSTYPSPVSRPTPVSAISPSKSPPAVTFPLQAAESLDGIISYLTRKHGGNGRDNGIVTVTSKSVHSGAVRNLTDLSSDSSFCSRNLTTCASARLITQSDVYLHAVLVSVCLPL
jgi:hypothetical protein